MSYLLAKNNPALRFSPSLLSWLLSYTILPAQSAASPCACCDSSYRQIDFWVGHWEATADDSLAGTNQIILLQDSCVMQENWISATPGYSGTSYSFL